MRGHAGRITSDVRTFIIIIKKKKNRRNGKKKVHLSLLLSSALPFPLDVFSDESVLKSIDARQRRLRLFEVRMDFLFLPPLCPCCVFLE